MAVAATSAPINEALQPSTNQCSVVKLCTMPRADDIDIEGSILTCGGEWYSNVCTIQ